MQQVEQVGPAATGSGFTFNAVTESFEIARSGPAVDPPTVGLAEQRVEYIVGDGASAEVPTPEVDGFRILIHAQAYTPDQQQVLSVWNTAEPGGQLSYALRELRDKGYLDGGDDDRSVRVLALAGALLLAVGALEAAALSHPGLGEFLDEADRLIGALLCGEPIPPAELLGGPGDLGQPNA